VTSYFAGGYDFFTPGCSSSNSGSTNGAGTSAGFYNPQGLTADSADIVYVADTFNHIIRRVTPAGEVSTLAGTGSGGYTDGAPGTARFYSPTDLEVTSNDATLYVTDSRNHCIRVVPTDGTAVSYLAGSCGALGWVDSTGINARFYVSTRVPTPE
jgi:serine/threonine-protein kinase